MRESTNLSLASNVVLALSIALGGCDKFKRNDPPQPQRREQK